MEKVSVIIPNYNHANYLHRRIQSVLSQTYTNFELIILDDCSTDHSKEIIESYRDNEKISVIDFNTKNSGSVFNQWQKGISYAKGDYIWIAESDDWAEPVFLEEVLSLIASDKEVAFAYSDSYFVEEQSIIDSFRNIRNKLCNTDKWSYSYIKDGKEEIRENLYQYCTVNNASAVIFRKSLLTNNHLFEQNFKFIGDWFVYLNLALHNKIAYLNKPLNYYRSHQQNSSNNIKSGNKRLEEYFCLFNWQLKQLTFIDKKNIKEAYATYVHESLIRNWGLTKIKVYVKLFFLNIGLFFYTIQTSLKKSIKAKLGK